MTAKKFFHTEVAEGIYQISDTDKGPLESEPKSLAPGKATRNSYLVTGEREALLFDLALSVKGLRAYAESIAELPVRVVLSHAHVDHIYHVNREKEIWLHPADEKLLKKGMFPIQFPPLPCPALRFLHDGDTIDLGGRVLDVIHMPGHTDGSILLYDRNTKTLLSGDSVTRRLLYGMHSFVPIEEFCRGLHSLDLFKIETIYSAHDRCGLYPEHTKLMEKVMMKEIEIPAKTDKVPFVGIFETYETGNEYEREYMSFAIVHKKR